MTPDNLGDYCRQIEQHLTRINGGHLVRVVGPGFDLVRQWAEAGIPLSVVFRGIESKAERHRAGASRRPLRIEFCDADVLEIFDSWRRATGIAAGVTAGESGTPDVGDRDLAATSSEDEAPKRPSFSRHLARAVDRLGRAAGRLDLPDALRDVVVRTLTELTGLRELAVTARGKAREDLADRLAALDRQLLAGVRAAISPDLKRDLEGTAEQELAPYRGRLSGEAWRKAVDATLDRQLRDKFGLPTL